MNYVFFNQDGAGSVVIPAGHTGFCFQQTTTGTEATVQSSTMSAAVDVPNQTEVKGEIPVEPGRACPAITITVATSQRVFGWYSKRGS